ncbi:MAG TPA: glycosyl transferase family 2 [Prolixibacteraceae bacterium]|nr:glycosyl transferase family 2 [Prolixibacteraceae bacterium]
MAKSNNPSVFFSIIIPSYNDLGLLKQALDSVLWQSYKDVEIIIVDDSTTNEISEFIQYSNYADHICYFKNIPAKGAVQNWNYGLSLANGNYCILLHHDEYFSTNNILEELFLKFKSDKYGCIVINKAFIRQGNLITMKFSPVAIQFIFSWVPSLLYVINIVGPCSCIAFRNSGSPKFDENLQWVVDIDWYYRLFKLNKVLYINSLFMNSTYGHVNQISKNIDIKIQEKLDMIYLRKRTNPFSYLQLIYFLRFAYKILANSFFKDSINPIYGKV